MSRSKPQDWGVLDSNHEVAERAVILQTLKDPDSARIRFSKATRGVSHNLGDPVLVWYSWVYVNATKWTGRNRRWVSKLSKVGAGKTVRGSHCCLTLRSKGALRDKAAQRP